MFVPLKLTCQCMIGLCIVQYGADIRTAGAPSEIEWTAGMKYILHCKNWMSGPIKSTSGDVLLNGIQTDSTEPMIWM